MKLFRRSQCLWLNFLALALSSLGCLAIFNASVQFEDPWYFLSRQLLWILAGSAVMVTLSFLRSELLKKSVYFLYIFFLFLMIFVLFRGDEVNGMRGWISLGAFQIQPSELIKPFFCLAFSVFWQEQNKEKLVNEVNLYFKALAFLIFPLCLITFQPDFGTFVVFLLAFTAFYLSVGGRARFVLYSAVAIVPFFIIVLVAKPYVLDRLLAFASPESFAESSGYHLMQLKRTFANGGFLGQPFGQGIWGQAYLPLTHNDSIFASFTEVTGFVGAVTIIVFFAGLLFLTLRWYSAQEGQDYRHYTVLFCVFFLVIQAYLHISVNLLVFPPTGITLPFFSYGGSSLSSCFVMVGFMGSMLSSIILSKNRKAL
mgnify:CR=1 FL=1